MAGPNFDECITFFVLELQAFSPFVPDSLLQTGVATLLAKTREAGCDGQTILDRVKGATGWTSVAQIWPALATFEVFSGKTLAFQGRDLHWLPPPVEDTEHRSVRDAYRAAKGHDLQGVAGDLERPDPLLLSVQACKALRRRAGAPKFSQRLCRILESALSAEAMEEDCTARGLSVSAEEVWRAVLKSDEQGRKYLVQKQKDDRRRQRRREKKQRAKERKRQKGKGSASDSSDSASSHSSSTSGSSSSSDSAPDRRARASSRRDKRTVSVHTAASSKASYTDVPEFIMVKGVKHFRSKRSGRLVRCDGPPSSVCAFCTNKHWFWEAAAYGCPGPA